MIAPSPRRLVMPIAFALLGACTHGSLTPPSLALRAAEKIDPRLPVERALVARAPSGTIAQRLAALLGQARSGDAAYRSALGPAQRAVAAAGASGSESWISAQVALSALQSARTPTTLALSAMDAVAGDAVSKDGGIGASDLAAIRSASEEASVIDERQRSTIAELSARVAR